jgi:steroid 5-alpha reductase family enzyme
VSSLPVYIVLGNPSSLQQGLIWSDFIGIFTWCIGFGVEAVADYQKQVLLLF